MVLIITECAPPCIQEMHLMFPRQQGTVKCSELEMVHNKQILALIQWFSGLLEEMCTLMQPSK